MRDTKEIMASCQPHFSTTGETVPATMGRNVGTEADELISSSDLSLSSRVTRSLSGSCGPSVLWGHCQAHDLAPGARH